MNMINHAMIFTAMIILAISMLVALYQLVKSILFVTKLVMLEVIANLLLAGICLFAIVTHHYIYLDICLALALVMFISTIAFVQYLTSSEYHDG